MNKHDDLRTRTMFKVLEARPFTLHKITSNHKHFPCEAINKLNIAGRYRKPRQFTGPPGLSPRAYGE